MIGITQVLPHSVMNFLFAPFIFVIISVIDKRKEEGKILIDNVVFSSAAEKAGVDFDQEILNIQVPTKRLPKELMFIPASLLYAFVWFVQRNRKKKLVPVADVAAA